MSSIILWLSLTKSYDSYRQYLLNTLAGLMRNLWLVLLVTVHPTQWYINGCSPALIHAFSDVFKVDNISWHTKWILKCHLFGFSLVCILIHLYLLQYEKKTARIMFHFSNVYVLDYSRFGVFWGAWILKFLIFFRLLYSASNSTRCVWNKNI